MTHKERELRMNEQENEQEPVIVWLIQRIGRIPTFAITIAAMIGLIAGVGFVLLLIGSVFYPESFIDGDGRRCAGYCLFITRFGLGVTLLMAVGTVCRIIYGLWGSFSSRYPAQKDKN